ncbi:1,2-phenylacetyl-CoA epoxidase subunit PaaC [Streptomyces profundus]|uniref:1,2-phenylacetyl-CoA epoxidase subunit PaaC n=1 Tax=Streptomyces profundus TaxID=2867410 RepID=UPI001D161EF9|nr:1,2-phenylacetyl-CoA epoxidase subunit PaaC [Streptomyces sp. MA3_2.13]UED88155.1 phenylacetate-CoA oxygenase subunit PaaC [Streptomyces sp. MA3_2.13]
MRDDHVYAALSADDPAGDARWAFGTGFADPLHGVDDALPPGVDGAALAACCLALGDDALLGAQRLAEWCSRAPELEIELALANIGLDLLGQARLLYARAGQVDGSGRDEDAYAYRRPAREFRALRLTQLPRGDFAFTVVRLLVLSTTRLALCQALSTAPDPVLRAVAERGVKELTYHRRFAAEWVIRLGDGTEESHRRLGAACSAVAPWLAEALDDEAGAAFGASAAMVREETSRVLARVADAAGVPWPMPGPTADGGGRVGAHTEHLGPLLAELRSVAEAHPDATW